VINISEVYLAAYMKKIDDEIMVDDIRVAPMDTVQVDYLGQTYEMLNQMVWENLPNDGNWHHVEHCFTENEHRWYIDGERIDDDIGKVIEKIHKLAYTVPEKIPPIAYYDFQGSSADINPYGRIFIGSYLKEDGLRFAEQLRTDGFTVIVRGRGPREQYHNEVWEKEKPKNYQPDEYDYLLEPSFKHWKKNHLDYLPIKYASHVALYIPPFPERTIEEVFIVNEDVPARVRKVAERKD
jgi:hypothetical protein